MLAGCQEALTNKLHDLAGVIPPMITPFTADDKIDFKALANEARYLKKSGCAGMVIGGSMGEGAGMSAEELAEAIRVTIEATEGALHVFGAVIADSSREGVRLAKAIAEAGAVGLQVPPPHFYPTGNTEILAEYYGSLTSGSGLPLIIYNVMPTAQAAVESLEQIIDENPLIIAVKQSGRNIHTLAALLATVHKKVKLFSAIDDMIYPSFVLGVDGTISGTSALFPAETVLMRKAVLAGDHAAALALHERLARVWRAVDSTGFAGNAKYAITLVGERGVLKPRRPLTWPAGAAAKSIEAALRSGGFLPGDSAAVGELTGVEAGAR
jgi:4-hydroxy-tetrahydrodipicolinate synthase